MRMHTSQGEMQAYRSEIQLDRMRIIHALTALFRANFGLLIDCM